MENSSSRRNMQEFDRERATDIPSVLLANCWSLIAAERRRFVPCSFSIPLNPRIRVEVTNPIDSESFTFAFMRSLYNRFDEDRDGRLGFHEVCLIVWPLDSHS